MAELIANEDMKVAFSNSAGPPDLVYSGDQGIDLVKIVPTLDQKVKANGKKVATTATTITFTAATPCPHTSATHVFVAGAAVIQTSAQKVKASLVPVHRQGDSSLVGCIGSWTNISSGATVPCSCGVEISEAGQDKVKGE